MIVDRLRKAFHEMIVDKLERPPSARSVFFVGAGISVPPPSNLPTFNRLNKKIIQLATGNILDDEEYESLSDIRPEVVLQILIEELGPKVLQALEIMIKADPNPNHFFLAQALEEGNWVFTTNYDNLIEKVCEDAGIGFEKCYRDSDFDEFQKYIDGANVPGGYIFKLHGSIEEENKGEKSFESILIALRQVGRGLNPSKRRVLKYFLENFDFYFMGYSCQDDFSVFPILLETDSRKRIFWFKYAKGEIGELVWGKERLLHEKEREEDKPPEEYRDWETIDVNDFLLTRELSFKFIGDSSRFVKETLRFPLNHDLGNRANLEGGATSPLSTQWAEEISPYQKNLIAGRLFTYIENLDTAKEYYKRAEETARDEEDKALAQRGLTEAHYKSETKKDYAEAIRILKEETLPIFEGLGDIFEVARTKTDIANNLRRSEALAEALRYAEEARQLFEDNSDVLLKQRNEEYELEFARCLNILGLIHYAYRTQDHLNTGLEICNKSEEIRARNGDVNGVAQCKNAKALIAIEQARSCKQTQKREAIQLLNQATTLLEDAVDNRRRTGDFRGCRYHFRNLGLAHTELAKLAQDKKEREAFLWNAVDDYEKGISYMKRARPALPVRGILEFRYRKGESLIKLGEIDKAIPTLRRVELKRDELGDWHNRARALDLLREAYEETHQEKNCIACCLKIISIYRNVLSDKDKLQEMKKFTDKSRNAREILERTSESLMRANLIPESQEIDSILGELTQKVQGN